MDASSSSPVRVWLQSLYDEHGYLTPELVRDAARSEDSPGHLAVFGVGVDEAAEAFYLIRAHKLIQSVRVIYHPQPDKEPVQIRAYHAVPGGEETPYVYRSTEFLRQNPDQLQLAKNEAARRLNDAEKSLRSLDALAISPASAKKTKRALTSIQSAQRVLATV